MSEYEPKKSMGTETLVSFDVFFFFPFAVSVLEKLKVTGDTFVSWCNKCGQSFKLLMNKRKEK